MGFKTVIAIISWGHKLFNWGNLGFAAGCPYRIITALLLISISSITYASCENFQEVFKFMRQRAYLLKDITANKYHTNPKQGVFNSDQELKILKNVISFAKKENLEKYSTMQFAQIQMDMSKQVEQYWLNKWFAHSQQAPKIGTYQSLDKLRQQLSDIDKQLYSAIAHAKNVKNQCSSRKIQDEFDESFKGSVEGIPSSPDFSNMVLHSILQVRVKVK